MNDSTFILFSSYLIISKLSYYMIFCLIFCNHVLPLLGYIHFKSLSFFFHFNFMYILGSYENTGWTEQLSLPKKKPWTRFQTLPTAPGGPIIGNVLSNFSNSVKKSFYLHIWTHAFISLWKFVLYFCSFFTLGWFAMTSFFHQYIFFYFVFHLYADFNQSS